MIRRTGGIWIGAGLALCLVGCTPSPGSSNSSEPSASPSAAAVACPPIDLRTPAGDRIDLNGTWLTEKVGIRGGIYYFRQVGSCIWFAGGFTPPGDLEVRTALGYITVVFHGTLGSDFTIDGVWIDARDEDLDASGAGGTINLHVEVNADETLRLVYVDGAGEPFLEPGYRENQSWIKISDYDTYPPQELMP